VGKITWGRPGTYILDMGVEIAVMGRVARIWEEYDSVLSSD
jgi:hypothetical protein